MKYSASISLQKASKLAEKLYENAKLHSAYDAQGHLLYLVAKVPHADFARLYGTSAFSCVLINGRWIVFYQHDQRISAVEKNSGENIHAFVKKDALGWGQLLIQHKGKTIFKRTLQPMAVIDFQVTSSLVQGIAEVYVRYFTSTSRFADSGRLVANSPAIHILPELGEPADFISDAVELH